MSAEPAEVVSAEFGDEFVTVTLRVPADMRVGKWALFTPVWRDGIVPCADGNLVHDFQGKATCPACGWDRSPL